MANKGGFDYLDSVSKDSGSRPKPSGNMSVEQEGVDKAPVEGGEGYIGGNSNASTLGLSYVTGKKGSVTDRKIWSEVTDDTTDPSRLGAGSDPGPHINPPESDPTDENASYKNVATDEGQPQTYLTERPQDNGGGSGTADEVLGGEKGANVSKSAGGFGLFSGSETEPDNVQSYPSPEEGEESFPDMPQTTFTSDEGGGAPKFKRSK